MAPPAGAPTGVEALFQVSFSMWGGRALQAAVRHALFTHVAHGKRTREEVAKAAATDAHATGMLLDAMCGFGLLTKSGAQYALTPVSSQFLVNSSPDYFCEMMEGDGMWDLWSHLAETVKTGKSPMKVEAPEAAEQFFPVLVKSLHVMHREPSKRAAEALLAEHRGKGLRVLDVAAGSGVWGIALAEADPTVRVTAHDFPGVLATARSYTKRHGVADRFDELAGDLKAVDFGKDRYDLAILGHIVHSEGEASSRALFRRLHAALRPGGRVAIHEFVPSDDRTSPPFPLLFALNMLLHTEQGNVYTMAEYRRWLNEAGFPEVTSIDAGGISPMIVARRT